MEAVNGVSEGDKGGPPPPSPLTGCYLLIVIGEPHCNEHKDIILQRVAKGLLSWDVTDCLVDLEKELAIITEQALEGEEARYGERLIQFASENLVTEILIHPVVSTLAQCVRNLLSSFTRHRHIIHAGYTFANNGSWVLQDGTFSSTDFSEAFQEIEVLRVIRAYENGISLHLHCAPEGDWTRLPKEPFTKGCKVRVNSNDVLTAGSPSISSFINYLEPFLVSADLESVLESSDVVGNIRFSRPTLYVFPGGQGDAALFGINGFNMLLDGGFSRKACFWDFVRHLDRLDAVLLTRLNNSNVNGISAVLKRKKQNALYPQIGHFFCNIQERKAILSPDGDKDKDPLLINLLEEGQDIVSNLRHLSLIPQVCYRDSEPINLYHKVGHGTLDMYVLSPAKDSKEVREFLQKWNNNDQKLFANQRTNKEFVFPLQNLVSICALLVWQPANPEDTITRILFPGSSPQNKIFEGLEKVKSLDFIKHPVCSEKSLAPASIIKAKQSVIDKLIQPDKKLIDNKKDKGQKPTQDTNETEIKNGDVNGVQPAEKGVPVKKSDSTESEKSISKPRKIIENGDKNENGRPKPKPQPKTKPRSDSQQRKIKTAEKKPSPTTPKKQGDKLGDDSAKPKPKPSPTSTPAKSTKEANNRKVLESKIKSAPPKKEAPKPATDKKEVKAERKPISRRPKDISKVAGSPSKKVNGIQKPDSISKRGKLDKEGTTDSSTVSTPSAEQDSILKKDISKLTSDEIQNLKAQELADLKEEQEAVKEIEAVFRKGELQQDKPSDFRKIKDLSIDDKLESEEYLIIEKTEIEQDLVNESNKEEETQKIARDSEESEKQRKLSEEKEPAIEEKREEIQEEVQKIITSATDIVKAKEETVDASKEVSVTSPEDKVDVSTDKKDVEEVKEVAQESQPDEKGSANIESGATTTAPTLPEDERMPLDEIKEDNGDQIEEKHVKEDTKEKDVPVIQLPPKTFENITKLPPVVGIRLDKQSHIRDIVKTPDEVADLPVHEEVEFDHYDEYPSATETKSEPEEVKKDEVEKVEKKDDKKEEVKEDLASTEKADKVEETKEAKTAVDKEKTDLSDKKEEIAIDTKNETEVPKESPKKTEPEVKTVISEDLNKKELSKSPDEEKDTDEHELEQKKVETKETKLSSQEIVKDEKIEISDKPSVEKFTKLAQQPIPVIDIKPAEITEITESVPETIESEANKEDKEQEDQQKPAEQPEKKEDATQGQTKVEEVIEKSETEVKEKDDIKEKTPEHKLVESQEKEKIDELSHQLPEVPKHKVVSEPVEESKLKEDATTIHKIDEKLQKLKDESIEVVETEPPKVENDIIVPKIEETELKEKITSIEKIDEKLQKLKEDVEDKNIKAVSEVITHKLEEPQHAEPVIITTDSQPDSPETDHKLFDDKLELGRKSPKEREEDVAKIVASVAEVLKSDAPLEEFEGKIPFSIPYKSYTTELRETHITTVDSPVTDEDRIVKAIEETICPKVSSSYLIEEERKIAPIHEEPEVPETRASKMIKDSKELMQATSKMIHDIKQTSSKSDTIVEESAKEDEDQDQDQDQGNGTVHRMLVTASSEDGGEETEICPVGTITFSRSSESSGRSSPDPQSQKVSQKSSIADTFSDATVITKTTTKEDSDKTVDPSIKDDVKNSEPVIEKAVCDNKNLVTDNLDKEIIDQTKAGVVVEHKDVNDEKKVVQMSETSPITVTETNKDAERKNSVSNIQNDVSEIIEKEIADVQTTEKVEASDISKNLDEKVEDVKTEADKTDLKDVIKNLESEIEEVLQKSVDSNKKEEKEAHVDVVSIDQDVKTDIKPTVSDDKQPSTSEKKDEPVLATAEAAIQKQVDSALGTVEAAIKEVKNTVESKIDTVSKEVENEKSFLGGLVNDIGASLLYDTTKLIEEAQQQVNDMKESAKTQIEALKDDITAKKEVIEDAVVELKESTEKEKESLTEIAGSSKSVADELKECATIESEKLAETVKDFEKSVVKEAESVTEQVKSEINSTKETVEEHIKNVQETLSTQKQVVTGVITDIKDAVTKDVETKIEEIKQEANETKESAKSKVEDVCKVVDLKKDIAATSEKVKEAVSESKKDLEDAKNKVKDEAIAGLKDLESQTESVLKDLSAKEENMIKTLAEETKQVAEKFQEKKDEVAEKLEGLGKDLTQAESALKETVESTLNEISSVKKGITEATKSDKTIEHQYDLFNGLERVEKMVVDVLTADREVLSKPDEKSDTKKAEDKAESFVDKGLSDVREFVEETKEAITSIFKDDSSKEAVLEKSAHDIEENFEIVSDMAKSVIFEKCDKTSEEEHKLQEKQLEKSAKSLEEDYGTVTDMAKSIVFDKCEKLTEEEREERVLERSANDIEQNYKIMSDMTQSVVFDKCEKTHNEEEQNKTQDSNKKDSKVDPIDTIKKEESDSKVAESKEDSKDEKKYETVKSGKSSPEKLETKDKHEDLACQLSGKSSPALTSELKDLTKDESGKSTPDLKETDHIKVDNQDSLLSGKSSPGLSGKSSPLLSGRSSPGGKAESKDSLLSGKSTPEHTKPDSKESSLSGKSSPGMSTELKPDEKDKLQAESEDKSGKSSPTGSGKVSPALPTDVKKEKSDKSSPVDSEKASPIPASDKQQEKTEQKEKSAKSSPPSSGKASPMPSDDIKQDKLEKKSKSAKSSPAGSGKASPAPSDDIKQDKLTKKEKSAKSSPAGSGKASPAPPDDIKQDNLEKKEKSAKSSPAGSGKASPAPSDDIKQDKLTKKEKSAKSSPAGSGKASPAPSDDIKQDKLTKKEKSAKSSPAGSGKSSPAPSDDIKQDELEKKEKSAKSSPAGSGKSSPAPSGDLKQNKLTKKEKSAKSSPAGSGKASPAPSDDIKQDELEKKEKSAKSSPAGSGKASPAPSDDIKQEKLTKKEKSAKSSPAGSGKASPAPSDDIKQDELEKKEKSAKSSPAGSGKSSPAPSDDLKQDKEQTKEKSAKSSPVASGKASPAPSDDLKQDKSEKKEKSAKSSPVASGKASPAPSDDLKQDKQEKKEISAKSSPAGSGKASPAPSDDLKQAKEKKKDKSPKSSPAGSGKASPVPSGDKKQEKTVEKQTSGKSTPVDSGKTSPLPSHDLKQDKADRKEKSPADSGKASPVPSEKAEQKEKSAKTSPTGSGKASPVPSSDKKQEKTEQKQKSRKSSPTSSGKTSPAPVSDVKVEQTGLKATSAKSSPASSGKASPAPLGDVKLEKETLSSEVKDVSAKSSPAGSGKASPALISDVKTTEEAKIKIDEEKKESSPGPVTDAKVEKEEVLKIEHKPQVTEKNDAKSEKDLSAKAPDIPADIISSPEKKTDEEQLRKTSLDVQESKEKKLSISDVQISLKTDEQTIEKSTSDLSKSLSTEDTKPLDDKFDTKDVDSIDSGIGTEGESKTKKEELNKTSTEQTAKIQDVKSTTKEESIAGPSVTLPDPSLTPVKSSTEDLHLSGKSTPDIAEVEKMKETQCEKHIPGSSTPPTVPVSPNIKDVSSTQSEDLKVSSSAPVKSSVASLKDNDLRSCTPGSDDYEIGASTHSDISSGQVSRAPHLFESEKPESDEDDEVPGSPMSVTSQVAHSRSSSRYDFEDERIGTKMDPMNTSFYGALPDDEDPELDFEKALAEHRQTRGQDLVLAAEESPSYLYEVTKAKYSARTPEPEAVTGQTQLDQINKNEANVMTASFMGELPSTTAKDAKDIVDSWGKPLGLPSPAPPNDNRGTPKKERKLPSNVSAKNKLNERRAESPSKYKNKKLSPVYVDLTYVPHHGNSYYSYVDFFKRVRARYYVFSGIEPSREVYNALLEAKQTWEDKELEVTIIPTYDTDILGYWVAENEELLTKYKIDLSPSASRCTINLQDHETSCSAYRLEF